MTKKDTLFVREVLMRISSPDEQVKKAIAFLNRDLAIYNARKGQMKENYDFDDLRNY